MPNPRHIVLRAQADESGLTLTCCYVWQSLIEHTSVDHHDYRDLLDALSLVSAAASHNNEHIRRTQNMERLTEVQACFEADTEINLFDSPSREFVREGLLLKLAGKGARSIHIVERCLCHFQSYLIKTN